ncbi:MAG: mechanosensitive ion channel domain-containing protein [Phycisphaerales bacterium JB052]
MTRPIQRTRTALIALLISAVFSHGVCAQPYTPDEQQTPTSGFVEPEVALQAAEEALSQIEGLEDGEAQVLGSVITITGTADDASVIDAAERAVIAATGAERVKNDITLSLDLQDRTRGAANRVSLRVESWIGYLPVIPIALLVVLIFALLAWLLGKLHWPFARFTRNPFLQDIVRKLAQTVVMLSGVLLALDILDAMALVGGVLGAAGVAGIAIGFAFKDLIENYIASILLSLRQPFRPQDHVLIDGHEGLVTAMNTRTTVLTTFDGNVVRIPNATVFKTTIINYTTDPRRRFGFAVGVGSDVDLAQAIEVGTNIIEGTPGVLETPKPAALITKLGDSSITVQLYGWVDQSQHSFGKVQSIAMQNVKAEYDRLSIDMPEPIYKIRIEEGQISHTPTPPPTKSPEPDSPPKSNTTSDVSRDDTISTMSQQTGDQQGDENLLDEQAPAE